MHHIMTWTLFFNAFFISAVLRATAQAHDRFAFDLQLSFDILKASANSRATLLKLRLCIGARVRGNAAAVRLRRVLGRTSRLHGIRG